MLDFLLGKSGLTFQQFQSQFKEFIIDNRLVVTAAGVTIGITTKDLIQSFVGDIVIPFFYLLAFQFGINKTELLPGKTTFDFTSFFRQIITWILSVIAIFFFVYYFFMSIVGIHEKNISSETTPSSKSSTTSTTPTNNNKKNTNIQQTTNPTTTYANRSSYNDNFQYI
jgi:large-conductance mechanosensitive channel